MKLRGRNRIPVTLQTDWQHFEPESTEMKGNVSI
jgi:hypothetical protein